MASRACSTSRAMRARTRACDASACRFSSASRSAALASLSTRATNTPDSSGTTTSAAARKTRTSRRDSARSCVGRHQHETGGACTPSSSARSPRIAHARQHRQRVARRVSPLAHTRSLLGERLLACSARRRRLDDDGSACLLRLLALGRSASPAPRAPARLDSRRRRSAMRSVAEQHEVGVDAEHARDTDSHQRAVPVTRGSERVCALGVQRLGGARPARWFTSSSSSVAARGAERRGLARADTDAIAVQAARTHRGRPRHVGRRRRLEQHCAAPPQRRRRSPARAATTRRRRCEREASRRAFALSRQRASALAACDALSTAQPLSTTATTASAVAAVGRHVVAEREEERRRRHQLPASPV
jgi:hypothetical protein